MSESEWKKVCGEGELAEGALKLVKAGEDNVLVVRLEGRVFAVGNKCPHYECPLNEGVLLGRHVVCKCHDARFDLTTGKVISAPALNDLPVYPVRVEHGDVLLGPVEKAAVSQGGGNRRAHLPPRGRRRGRKFRCRDAAQGGLCGPHRDDHSRGRPAL